MQDSSNPFRVTFNLCGRGVGEAPGFDNVQNAYASIHHLSDELPAPGGTYSETGGNIITEIGKLIIGCSGRTRINMEQVGIPGGYQQASQKDENKSKQ